jgi:hypothetical protein
MAILSHLLENTALVSTLPLGSTNSRKEPTLDVGGRQRHSFGMESDNSAKFIGLCTALRAMPEVLSHRRRLGSIERA